jgi:hypothetical protein
VPSNVTSWSSHASRPVTVYDDLLDHQFALAALLAEESTLDSETAAEIKGLLDQVFTRLAQLGQQEAERRGWFSGAEMELTSRLRRDAFLDRGEPAVVLPSGRRRISREKLINHMTNLMLYGLRLGPPD